MFTFIDVAAVISAIIIFKTYKTSQNAFTALKLKIAKKPRTTYTGYASIETAILNRDVARCKNLYFGYLSSFEEKPDTLFLSFLFEALESRGVPVTQELINSIRYVDSKQ